MSYIFKKTRKKVTVREPGLGFYQQTSKPDTPIVTISSIPHLEVVAVPVCVSLCGRENVRVSLCVSPCD